MGIVAHQQNQFHHAVAYHQEALELRELIAHTPETPEGQLNWAKSLSLLATSYAEIGELQKAINLSIQAIDIQERLAKQWPEDSQKTYLMSLNNLGVLLSQNNQYKQAETKFKYAQLKLEELMMINPIGWEVTYARTLHNLGICLMH